MIPYADSYKHLTTIVTMLALLKKYNGSGVFALVSPDKKIRIMASSNMLTSLSRILTELVGNEKIVILKSGCNSNIERNILAGHFVGRYKALGWQVDSYYSPWQVQAKVLPFSHGEHAVFPVFKQFLIAKNTYQRVVLGVFNTKTELEVFRKQFYKKNKIKDLVIASNVETKQYYIQEGT